jgi:hypothetical protein
MNVSPNVLKLSFNVNECKPLDVGFIEDHLLVGP